MARTKTTCCSILLTLFSCGNLLAQDFYPKENGTHEFAFKINSSLPEFRLTFYFFFDSLGNSVGPSRIEIRRADKQRILQKIETPIIVTSFRLEDMNFDGYLDLLLAEGTQGTGGSLYDIWFYQPRTGQFKYDPQFQEITCPVPNPKTKEITSYYSGGADYRSVRTFHFENNKLILLREVESRYNEALKAYIQTTTNYRLKKVVSIKKDTLKLDQ